MKKLIIYLFVLFLSLPIEARLAEPAPPVNTETEVSLTKKRPKKKKGKKRKGRKKAPRSRF